MTIAITHPPPPPNQALLNPDPSVPSVPPWFQRQTPPPNSSNSRPAIAAFVATSEIPSAFLVLSTLRPAKRQFRHSEYSRPPDVPMLNPRKVCTGGM
jgi:hypothetical protein